VAVSVVDAPAHIEEDDALTDTLGAAFTIMVVLDVTEQPLALVPVTEYVVVTDGLTVMLAEIAPVFHKKLVAPVTVNVVDAPAQIELEEAEILIDGTAFTTIVFDTLAEQPLLFVPVTE
jgi:hypothetical protein